MKANNWIFVVFIVAMKPTVEKPKKAAIVEA